MAKKAEIKKAHEVSNKSGVAKIVRENPLVRIGSADHIAVVVQSGQVMDDSGVILDPIPDWFWEEYAKVSPEMQEAVGLESKAKK